jgi:hypothetical protein
MGQRKDANVGAKSRATVPELLTLEFKGLSTYPNQFGSAPAGSFSVAENCSLDAPGVIDCRRGKYVYATGFTSAFQGLTFDTIGGMNVMHASDSKIYIDNGSGTFTAAAGTFTVPDSTDVESRVRTINISNNLYMTTGGGVYKLQNATSSPVPAGAPAGLGGSGVPTGASGFIASNVNVAYRVVWLYIDTNNNLVQGPPSDRVVVSNTGSAANVNLTFIVPTGINVNWTYRVYRSNQSATATSEPDDQMQLVYSGSPTAGQISSRIITILDSQPDALRGETLYTTTQGIQNANYAPPFSHDIALFKGSTFYSNCSLKQTFFMTLISGSLLQNGDTISFFRGATLLFTITGGAAENIATGTFLVATGGTPSANISLTAQSMVKVINLYASNFAFDAFYSSGYNESPGKMTLTDRAFNTTTFSVVCSRTGNVFTPSLPASGANNNNTSSGNNNPHYLYFSKYLQPEAVPLANTLAVGSSAYPILRVIALRNSLIVLKSDGIYRITGTSTANFTVVPVDIQQRISSANSAVSLNNCVYVMTEQGAVTIQDNGAVQLISMPIQFDVNSLTTSNYPGYKGATWGMAYPSEFKYILYTLGSTADTTATKAYIFNYVTGNWSTDTQAFTAGYINPTDGKFYGSQHSVSGTSVYVERKSLTDLDYADEEYPVNVVSFSGYQVSLTSANGIGVGMTLGQAGIFSYITNVDHVSNIVTVSELFNWANGSAKVYQPIAMQFTLNPVHGGDPTCFKQFSEMSIVTLASTLSNLSIKFTNDMQQTQTIVPTIKQPSGGAFGVGGWGVGPYGGVSAPGYLRSRLLVPATVQKANWLVINVSVAQAFKRVRFSGIQIVARKISVRQR